MTSLHRVVVEWAGTGVYGRAVTVLHYSASDNAAPPCGAIAAAFNASHALWPNGLTITVPQSGDTIDDVTGNLIGSWTAAGTTPTTGDGGTTCAAGAGAVIGWTTGGIVPGKKGPRKLRGRSFLVPLATSNYDTNGTLQAGAVSAANALATGLMGAGPLAIWHRPNPKLGLTGNSYGVQSFRVRDKVAILTSRRD